MKQILFISFILLTGHVNSQVLNSGFTVSGGPNDYQWVTQTYIDHAGDRYHVFNSIYGLDIDSTGTKISIVNPHRNSSYLVKYNRYGNYLYHIYFPSSSIGDYNIYGDDRPQLSISFDEQNNLFVNFVPLTSGNGLTGPGISIDTIYLKHADGTLFKKILNKRKGTLLMRNPSYIFKISPEGRFQWFTSVSQPEAMDLNRESRFLLQPNPVHINRNNEISFYYDNYRKHHIHDHDTITISNMSGQLNQVFVSDRDLVIRLDKDGNFISCTEPYKNRYKRIRNDTLPEGYHRSISNRSETYHLHRFHSTATDTFLCETPVVLKPGLNYLLIKTDINDSIIWATNTGTDQYTYPEPSYYLDFDSSKNELLYAVNYAPPLFEFSHDPFLSSGGFDMDIFVSRIDANTGSYKWYRTFRGSLDDGVNSFTYNKASNELILVGNTKSNDLYLENQLISRQNNTNITHFISILDSNNHIYTSQAIKSSRVNLSIYSLGYPITDPLGRTYFGGWFHDSIMLNCETLKKIRHPEDEYTTLDGFVIGMNPIPVVDTGICKTMLSPSGKFIWDSTAVYFDTIPDAQNCDSIIRFRVTMLNSSAIIDTNVCKQFKSISGKYLWTINGIYTDTISNHKGCDSVITINLTILQTNSSIDTAVKRFYASPSNKYLWDSSGAYYDTIPNKNGCDSIIKISLRITETRSTIDTVVCKKMISPSGNYVYESENTYIDTIPNKEGSDSIITIRLKIQRIVRTVNLQSCDSLESFSGKFVMKVSGIYTDTIVNNTGCDTIFMITYQNMVSTSSLNINLCDSFKVPGRNIYITESGTYYDTIPNQNGCDSIISINFKKLSSASSFTINTCDSFVSPGGKVFTYSGSYSDTIPNHSGCDSIISIQLNLTPFAVSISKSNDISCDSPFAVLSANGGTNYKWTPAHGLSSDVSSSPVAQPDSATTYYLHAVNAQNCVAYDSIHVNVSRIEPSISFNNVFTPNSDGINDCFVVADSLKTIEFEMNIYNRWGILVFSSRKAEYCWNGNDQEGNPVNEGVYYLVTRLKTNCGNRHIYRGSITLIR